MIARVLAAATTTGAFCVIFAFCISRIAPNLSDVQLLGASFVSGFLGSLVASTLLRGYRSNAEDQ